MNSAFAGNWSFRPANVPRPWSKASKIKGGGPRWSWEWKIHENFVCTRSPAVEKNVPSMGALRRSPSSQGPLAQNVGPKSPLPRRVWALDSTGSNRVDGGSCASAGPPVLRTAHDPSGLPQASLCVHFRVAKKTLCFGLAPVLIWSKYRAMLPW